MNEMPHTDYEDIEIVKGSGFIYRFYSRFPAIKMYDFNYALVNAAKKEIYNAMRDNGELNDNPVGYSMVLSGIARSWVFRDGFTSPTILKLLCDWIIEPITKDAPPALDALLEADELSSGSWKDEEIEKETPTNLSQLLSYIVERDIERKAGLNMLKLFFIALITRTNVTGSKPESTTPLSAKVGRGKKASSQKASASA